MRKLILSNTALQKQYNFFFNIGYTVKHSFEIFNCLGFKLE